MCIHGVEGKGKKKQGVSHMITRARVEIVKCSGPASGSITTFQGIITSPTNTVLFLKRLYKETAMDHGCESTETGVS